MPRIALTGGIGSGKSFVAAELARRGAVIIDSDVLAREVVEPGTPGLARIEERFGSDVLEADGSLNRARLGEIVFADDNARADLNAIVHPLVRERSIELEASAPPERVVVHVIPLLVETGLHETFDHVIVVDVPVETQASRVTQRDGLPEDEARRRIAAQASRDARLLVATWVIDNDGDRDHTVAQVDRLWPELVSTASN